MADYCTQCGHAVDNHDRRAEDGSCNVCPDGRGCNRPVADIWRTDR